MSPKWNHQPVPGLSEPSSQMFLDYFDKVFVISLSFREDRRQTLCNAFRSLDLIDPDQVSWVTAVDGRLCPPPGYFSAGSGAWGCYQTHLRIVQDAAMAGLENYLVIEDDAIFSAHSRTVFEAFMNQLPGDWDQIFLGGEHLSDPEVVPYRPMVMKVGQVTRTHAYALRNTAYNVFQQHVASAPDYMTGGQWHIDHQIGMAHLKKLWNTYLPSWWICGQGAGDSDIANQSNPPLWWHWSRWAHSLPYLYLNPDDSLRPDLRPWIHFGDHLGGSSCVSKDLDQHLRSNLSLADWLKNNAESALCHNKLPGICHPKISLENLTCQWGSGVMKAKETDLRKIIDYPFNGLFRHPVNRERERPREEFVLKCESFVTKPSGF